MNRVETPQPSNLVADQMHHGDAEIGNQHCEDDLKDKRKTARPQPVERNHRGINGITATLTKMRDSLTNAWTASRNLSGPGAFHEDS